MTTYRCPKCGGTRLGSLVTLPTILACGIWTLGEGALAENSLEPEPLTWMTCENHDTDCSYEGPESEFRVEEAPAPGRLRCPKCASTRPGGFVLISVEYDAEHERWRPSDLDDNHRQDWSPEDAAWPWNYIHCPDCSHEGVLSDFEED